MGFTNRPLAYHKQQLQLLTIEEVCGLLQVSKMTLYRIMERGELPWTMAGASRRFRAIDVDEYQRARGTLSSQSPTKAKSARNRPAS